MPVYTEFMDMVRAPAPAQHAPKLASDANAMIFAAPAHAVADRTQLVIDGLVRIGECAGETEAAELLRSYPYKYAIGTADISAALAYVDCMATKGVRIVIDHVGHTDETRELRDAIKIVATRDAMASAIEAARPDMTALVEPSRRSRQVV